MARAGRKRKPGVKREANGRPTRAGRQLSVEQENMRTAVEYRQSVFGVSAKDAMDQKASTAIGRLCLQGIISEHQWQAAEEWARLVNAYHAAINAPRGFKSASGAGAPPDDDALAKRCRSLKDQLDNANAAIKDYAPMAIERARFLALRTVVLEDQFSAVLEGELRVALNSLVKHFGFEGRKAA